MRRSASPSSRARTRHQTRAPVAASSSLSKWAPRNPVAPVSRISRGLRQSGRGRDGAPSGRILTPSLASAGEVDLGLVAVGAQPARAGVLDRRGETAQRGVAQQAAGERPDRVGGDAEGGAGPRQHLRGEQRVAAEGEEVIIEADVLPVQQPGPQGGQSCLRRRGPLACSGPDLARHGLVRRVWARAASAFGSGPARALRRRRQVVAGDERRRDHVAGQPVEQVAAEARGRRAVRGAVRARGDGWACSTPPGGCRRNCARTPPPTPDRCPGARPARSRSPRARRGSRAP